MALRNRWWLSVLAAWMALGALSVSQVLLASWHEPPELSRATLRWVLVRQGVDWTACALALPLLLWLVRRHPLETRRWWRNLALYLAMGAGLVALKLAAASSIAGGLGDAEHGSLRIVASAHFATELVLFLAVVGVAHALRFHERDRQRALEAAELAVELSEARLTALEAQLDPHFLFNTLNGVATLMHRDADAADRMLTRLAELLRATLERTGHHEVALREELALLERYLGIAQVRFGDRLQVELDVPEAALEVLVPRFLLQPLVENALQHGIQRFAGRGKICIAARLGGGELTLVVENDGPRERGDGQARAGIGLANTRARLAHLYGDDVDRLTLEHVPAGGARVAVRLPLERRRGDAA